MGFHRAHTNSQDCGYFLATFTLGQKLHNFPLAIGDATLFGRRFERFFSINIPGKNNL